MSESISDLVARAIAEGYAPGPINLAGVGTAITGTLEAENGGTGNELGLAAGIGARLFLRSGSAAPFGTLVAGEASTGSIVVPTTAQGQDGVVGVVADLGGIEAYGTGMVQVAGIALVLATGAITPLQLVRASATAGTCEAVGVDPTGAFGRAMSHATGGYVWVALMLGATGAPGTNGEPGTDGVGVPTGGAPGRVLGKLSSADYDTAWLPAIPTELLMQDGVTAPPEPLENEARDDWVYADG